MEAGYPPPVDKLLTYGDCRELRDWPNYLDLGLGPEHIPDLIRMAIDEELNYGDPDSLEVWAPAHAWRVLGQLRAEAAIEPLLGLLHRIDDDQDDWVGEELPEVFGMIGPAAIPAIASYLADASHPLYARIAAAHSLGEIGTRHPGARADSVAALTEQLEKFQKQDLGFNGFLISYLMDLRATESLPVIQRAFGAHRVDEMVAGDWYDVLAELRPEDLPPEEERRRVPGAQYVSFGSSGAGSEFIPGQSKRSAKEKAKRKQANRSRRKNRKR